MSKKSNKKYTVNVTDNNGNLIPNSIQSFNKKTSDYEFTDNQKIMQNSQHRV